MRPNQPFSFINLKVRGAFLSLGLVIAFSLPLLAQASQPFSDETTFTVRQEVSDQEMFGKKISSARENPRLLMSDTRPAASLSGKPARLRIPDLGIDTLIESVGLRNGQMDVPGNIWDVSWLNTSPWPGQVGNAVIAGHKDSVHGSAIFANLDRLQPGNKVFVSDASGLELTFEVQEVQSFGLDQAPMLRIFGPSPERQLNLITCDGTFITQQHSYDKRLVVYTKQI